MKQTLIRSICCSREQIAGLRRIWGRRTSLETSERNACHAAQTTKDARRRRGQQERERAHTHMHTHTCEGSVTRSVTTSSLVYLMKRWCSSSSCIFHMRSLLSWSKNWKNLPRGGTEWRELGGGESPEEYQSAEREKARRGRKMRLSKEGATVFEKSGKNNLNQLV